MAGADVGKQLASVPNREFLSGIAPPLSPGLAGGRGPPCAPGIPGANPRADCWGQHSQHFYRIRGCPPPPPPPPRSGRMVPLLRAPVTALQLLRSQPTPRSFSPPFSPPSSFPSCSTPVVTGDDPGFSPLPGEHKYHWGALSDCTWSELLSPDLAHLAPPEAYSTLSLSSSFTYFRYNNLFSTSRLQLPGDLEVLSKVSIKFRPGF